jgi:hypothetical protein
MYRVLYGNNVSLVTIGETSMNDLAEEEDEPLYCSVCHLPASLYCERCGDDICEICGVKDEGIIFCYECWLERERELQGDEDFEELPA